MATIVIRKTVDDLDNTEDGVATTQFGFEGVTYEIDLATPNYLRLREFLEPFVEAARRTGGRAAPRKVLTPGKAAETTVEVVGGNGNGHGHGKLGPTRNYLTDVAAPRDQSQNQLIRHWYAQQSPEVQSQLGVLHPRGSIRSNIVLAYQQAHGLAPKDDDEAGVATPKPSDIAARVRLNAMRDWYNELPTTFRAAHPWVAGDGPGDYIVSRYEGAMSRKPAESAVADSEVAEDSEAEKAAQAPAERPEPVRTELLPTGQTENAMIRAWYREQPYSWRAGHPLSDRGKVPATIRDAYFRRAEKKAKV